MARERNHPPSRPADAIKTLQIVLDNPRLEYQRKFVSADIADLRLAFSGADAFANAVLAVAREIAVALRNPAKYGKELSGKLR